MSEDTVTKIDSLVLQGTTMNIDIAGVLRDAVIDRTIDGASTLAIEIYDGKRSLLKSGIFSNRTTVTIDGYTFELVQVKKSGTNVSLVFEDLPVAALRRRNTPIKVSAGTVTHIDFAERMVKEEEWLNFWVPPDLRSTERTRIELARGQPDAVAGENPENSWAALGRIADERGWRRYVLNKDTIAYVPETYLLEQASTYTLREGEVGVEDIDFDFDIGKPTATLKVRVRAGRWAVPVGSAVQVEDVGPATGKWFVSAISRSLFSLFIDVSLTKARPVLPEPKPPEVAATTGGSASSGGFGSGSIPVLGQSSPTVPFAWNTVTYPQDPTNLVKIGQGGHRLLPSAANSFQKVQEEVGRLIPITDSYRSQASQAAGYLFDPTRFAKPGNSAHGEGRAVDVDLRKFGVGNQWPDPRLWHKDPTWKLLNEAFMKHGWCNYQYQNGTTKGRMAEPWHWSYQVCK